MTLIPLISVIMLALALLALIIIFNRRIGSSLKEIEALRQRQNKIEDDRLKSEASMLIIFEKLTELLTSLDASTSRSSNKADHTLALKVADETLRIEKNLRRIDPDTKGLKPLEKAVGRIKDNLMAAGYEVESYIGQPYKEGMRVNPEFVFDDTIPEGGRIITAASRPQVHYNGILLQEASVTVSQNI